MQDSSRAELSPPTLLPHNTYVSQKLHEIQPSGITELYCPRDGAEVQVDIVFVHGLMGSPLKTWLHGEVPRTPDAEVDRSEKKSKSSVLAKLTTRRSTSSRSRNDRSRAASPTADSSYCYWPLELLPTDIPNARILTYGYDSHPSHFYKTSTTRMTITQHYQNLLFALGRARSRCRGRPLIFCAHSLGGILVKGALNESKQMKLQPASADIEKSCCAILFFGTPHLGASIAGWGELVSNIVGALPGGPSTYSGVLKGLSPDSETLYNVTRRFNELINEPVPLDDKIRIFSIQEGQGMSAVKGLGSKVVPDYSSTFNRTDIEQVFVIQNQNHMNMCKFAGANTADYQAIVGVIQDYVGLASTDKAHKSNENDHIELKRHEEIMNTIDFSSRLNRQHQLSSLKTTKDSFGWVWSSSLMTWLQSKDKLFWLAGHPGSGKSTLINHVAKHETTETIMKRHHGPDCLIVKFFFDYRGDDSIQNNFLGFRRSMLYQILQQSSRLLAEIEKRFHTKQSRKHEWLGDEDRLTGILEHTLSVLECPMLLFIDGLDEYKGDKPDLISLIYDMCEHNIKLCVSSRDEKPFSMSFGKSRFFLRMDKVNRPGITAYARDFLQKSLGSYDGQEPALMAATAQKIATRSAGVFLWARFAVQEIIDVGASVAILTDSVIEERLKGMPQELRLIYARILQNKTQHDKVACGKILRLITSARRVLHVTELFEAACLAGAYTHTFGQETKEIDVLNFEHRVKVLGGGLLESISPSRIQRKPVPSGYRITIFKVIHRSVQTYLDEQGWTDLLRNPASNAEHQIWVDVCTAFLSIRELRETLPSQGPVPDFPVSCLQRYDPASISPQSPSSSLLHGSSSSLDNDEHEDGDETSRSARVDEVCHHKVLHIGLKHYIHRHFPDHLSRFEKGTDKSCWSLITEYIEKSFLKAHIQELEDFEDLEGLEDVEEVEICSYLQYALGLDCSSMTSAQFAVAHGMDLSIAEAIECDPGLLELKRTPTASIHELVNAQMTARRNKEQSIVAPKPSTVITMLQIAVMACLPVFYGISASTFNRLIETSAPVLDEDMFFAILAIPATHIMALLATFPPGRLNLQTRYPGLVLGLPDTEGAGLDTAQYVGVLGLAAMRGDKDSMWQLLDAFIDRGEEINAPCATFGTALQTVVAESMQEWSYTTTKLSQISKLMDVYGADPNVKTDGGNTLEYVWERHHTRSYDSATRDFHSSLTKCLVEHGAVITRPDPSGQVPSIDRILGLCKHGTISFDDWCIQRHLYLHGDNSDHSADVCPDRPSRPEIDELDRHRSRHQDK